MIRQQPPSPPISRTDCGIAALIWLTALALYIRTLAPSLLWGDMAEFQTLSYTLGMTHPSGYMTHIFIGKLFTLIPIRDIAWRVNLMSAFFGALAVANVYLITRLHGGWRAAGMCASALLALLEGFWWRALIAESYAPAAGFLSTIWLFVLLWDKTTRWQFLFFAGMLGGLSVGIHSTVVMTAASVMLFMLIRARTKSAWLGAAAGALIGAALTFAAFLYLDHNDPPSSVYNTVYRPALDLYGLSQSQFDAPLERLFAIFPAEHFWSYYFSATEEEIRFRLGEYVSFFSNGSAALIVAGMISLLARRHWHEGLYPLVSFLLVWGLGVTVAFSIYREFYVPAAVFVAVWLGAGASAALDGADWLARKIPLRGSLTRTFVVGIVSLGLVILPLYGARADLHLAIEKGYTSFIQRDHIYPIFAPDKAVKDAAKLLNKIPENAILFTDWDKLYSYVYTAEIVAGREDISLHEYLFLPDGSLPRATIAYIEANIDSRPIYFTIMIEELNELYSVTQAGESLFLIERK
ncbi:MAG: hypothetical protein HFACDABA_02825 [Anaerolineales bacterium]|nr:hypothetical protein [Anaerolineales bacterium]